MNIYYGIQNNFNDVTNICVEKLKLGNLIIIPSDDHCRASYFSDHFFGIHKIIFIKMDDNITEYDENLEILINIWTGEITTFDMRQINNKLQNIHDNLILRHGSLYEELPEQKMTVKYLNGTEKVLELGGNVGRNSLVISSILNDSSNLVSLETDLNIAKQLEENKISNNLNFKIENSALSKRKLIQKGWDTIPSDKLIEGYEWVNTITLEELNNKYNMNFDTLVIDCEGAFYYILMDMPEILNGINLIIMENDYHDIQHKKYVDIVLSQHNFKRVYFEQGGWGPCYFNFFEVWKK